MGTASSGCGQPSITLPMSNLTPEQGRAMAARLRANGISRDSKVADVLQSLADQVETLERALQQSAAAAGNPDAAEGCRTVISIARDTLAADA